MQRSNIYIATILSALISISCFAALPTSQTTSLAPMLKKVMPAVVNISVRGDIPLSKLIPGLKDKDQLPPQLRGLKPKFGDIGSGVIVDAQKGYILTNAHVIKDAQSIVVTLKDGRKIRGKVIGHDAASDIAIIQIRTKHLTALKFGDSDKLNVGDFVAAIGNPFGLQQTVTSGVVSGLERANLGIEGVENFIQTDAPINPGNSGGALVNMQGQLIGINTAIVAPKDVAGNIGIGLAIPSNMAKSVMEQLIKYGNVKRGILGVVVQNLTPELQQAFRLNKDSQGALVSQINPGSPAAKAGVKIGDIITYLNGREIHSALQVRNDVSMLRDGSKLRIDIIRNGKNKILTTTIVSREDLMKEAQKRPEKLLTGLQLRNFDQLISDAKLRGVQVLDVADTSAAFSSGLRPGDIIVSANNQATTTLDSLKEIAKQSPTRLLLTIKRGLSNNLFIVLEQ